MYLNDYGKIAAESWEWLSEHYNYVDIGAWVVMPNHFHGILIVRDMPGSETGSLDASPLQRKPLGRLMGAFKTVSTKRINAIKDTPGEPFWQRDYYEHIIRNLREFDFISEYIANNPTTWAQDKNNPANLNL
jgi:REP element-mobilizing transposase RayT